MFVPVNWVGSIKSVDGLSQMCGSTNLRVISRIILSIDAWNRMHKSTIVNAVIKQMFLKRLPARLLRRTSLFESRCPISVSLMMVLLIKIEGFELLVSWKKG